MVNSTDIFRGMNRIQKFAVTIPAINGTVRRTIGYNCGFIDSNYFARRALLIIPLLLLNRVQRLRSNEILSSGELALNT